MHTPAFNQDPLAQLVLEQQKPGALILVADTELDMAASAYRYLDLDVEKGRQRGAITCIAIARPALAATVLTSEIVSQIDQAAITHEHVEQVEGLSIAQALIHLDAIEDGREACGTRQSPEIAALLGVLLGYNTCDINYYIATRYGDQPRDEASTQLHESHHWSNSHILCGSCATDKLAELGAD